MQWGIGRKFQPKIRFFFFNAFFKEKKYAWKRYFKLRYPYPMEVKRSFLKRAQKVRTVFIVGLDPKNFSPKYFWQKQNRKCFSIFLDKKWEFRCFFFFRDCQKKKNQKIEKNLFFSKKWKIKKMLTLLHFWVTVANFFFFFWGGGYVKKGEVDY